MSVAELLDRLKGVRSRSSGQWLARCPSHADRSPSLSIRECDDGRVLICCFAGCNPADVLGAVSLTLADLFPKRLPDRHPRRRERHHLSARDALDIINREFLLVQIIAADMAAGRPVPSADFDRLATARNRLARIQEILQ